MLKTRPKSYQWGFERSLFYILHLGFNKDHKKVQHVSYSKWVCTKGIAHHNKEKVQQWKHSGGKVKQDWISLQLSVIIHIKESIYITKLLCIIRRISWKFLFHHCGRNVGFREYVSAEWTGAEKRTEPSPRLGLGTIYIAPLRGRNDLTTKVLVWSLGMVWEGVRHPRPPDLRVNFHSLCLTS